MTPTSPFAHRHFAVLLFVGMALIAQMCLANDPSPNHFQHEILSLPFGTYFDSQVLDLNGDGITDLAALSSGALYVLLADGSGNFSQPTPYNQDGFLAGLAFGDFDGDGFPDAAVTNLPGINVLLNDGTGGFPNSVFINTGEQPSGLAVADFNLDGKLDLAVSDFQANSISILLGDGNGGFAAPVISAAGTGPGGLIAGDFDHDGVPDLAAAEYGTILTGGDLRIFKGVGDGSFQTVASYPFGGNATDLVKADFNHDGNTDIAVGVFNSNQEVAVFLGDGQGGFAQSASVPGSAFSTSLAAADINDDGKRDLIFLDDPNYIDVALGRGNGTFRAVRQGRLPGTRSGSYTLSVGDVNDDGRIDIFAARGETSVLLLNMP
jgi:hypothetical protein